MYTRLNKYPSVWNFLSPELEVTWRTVAIIIWVVLLSPYFCIRGFSLSSIHYNQSHPVYINRRQKYICIIWNSTLIKIHSLSQACGYLAPRDRWVDRTVPFILLATVAQEVEWVLAVAFGNKLCWFESHYRPISLWSPGSWMCASSSLQKQSMFVRVPLSAYFCIYPRQLNACLQLPVENKLLVQVPLLPYFFMLKAC